MQHPKQIDQSSQRCSKYGPSWCQEMAEDHVVLYLMPTRHQLQSRPAPNSATLVHLTCVPIADHLSPFYLLTLSWTPVLSASTCICLGYLFLPDSDSTCIHLHSILNCIHLQSAVTVLCIGRSLASAGLQFMTSFTYVLATSLRTFGLYYISLHVATLRPQFWYLVTPPCYDSELNLFCLLFSHSLIPPIGPLTSDLWPLTSDLCFTSVLWLDFPSAWYDLVKTVRAGTESGGSPDGGTELRSPEQCAQGMKTSVKLLTNALRIHKGLQFRTDKRTGVYTGASNE